MEQKEFKTPEYQLKANKKYLSKFADIKIRVLPEFRTEIQAHAASMGESMAEFLRRAIVEAMERDQSHKKDT